MNKIRYQYCSIAVGGGEIPISSSSLHTLNKKYEEGWEFVESVPQNIQISAGASYHKKGYAPIIFTLRKEIIENILP